MANHLTPEELSKELEIDQQEVIRLCMQEGVPIYQGKIDKYLFQAQLAGARRAAAAALAERRTRRFYAQELFGESRPTRRLSSFAGAFVSAPCDVDDAPAQRLHEVDDRRLRRPAPGRVISSPASFASSIAWRSRR